MNSRINFSSLRNMCGFFLVLWLTFSSFIYSEIDPFYPQKGFTLSDTFNAFYSQYQVGSLFNNPSGLSLAKKTQFKIDYGQNMFDYKTIGMGVVVPMPLLVVGLGYHTYFSSDFTRVDAVSSNERPEIKGYFTHSIDNFMLSFAPTNLPFVKYGILVNYYKQSLDTDYVDTLGVDFGVMLPILNGWLGVYSQNGYLTNYRWNNSRFQEVLSRQFILELGWEESLYGISVLCRNLKDMKFNGIYRLSESFSLLGSWATVYDVTKYSYGVELSLTGFQLQYKRVQSMLNSFDFSEDILGILLSI